MRKLLIILFSLLSIAAFSQTNTYSPYSRFGLGDLSRQGTALNKSMGGTGIALRFPNSVNYINPASYSTMDTLSFLFDFGLYSNATTYKTSTIESNDLRSSIDHIIIGFPVTRWWKSSLGLVPYSRMGYDVLNYGGGMKYSFKGTGGLNQFYFGNSFKIKELSVGFNYNMVFGSLEQTHSYASETDSKVMPTTRFQQQSIRSSSLTLGAQYNIKLSSSWSAVLGVIYEGKSYFVSQNTLLVTNNATIDDTIVNPYTASKGGKFLLIDTVKYSDAKEKDHLPYKYGVGLTLNYNNKLIVSADYSKQNWSDYSFSSFDTLADARYLNFGIQFTPDEKAIRSYWKRINLRAGFYTTDTYLKVNSQQVNDYGLSFGLRFPFKGNRSSVQLSYEYGKRGTTSHNLVQENYHFINFSVTLYDFWFVKSKFD
jgi:hypothetical protein